MSVRGVTPHVTAISGHLQYYRDADHYDAFTDELATGEDIYASDLELPSGRGVQRFTHFVPGSACTAGASPRRGDTRVHASSPTEAGRDGRGSAPSPSQSVGAPSGAGESTEPPGGGLVGSPTGPRARTEPSSSPGACAGTSPLEDVRRPGGHRDAS